MGMVIGLVVHPASICMIGSDLGGGAAAVIIAKATPTGL